MMYIYSDSAAHGMMLCRYSDGDSINISYFTVTHYFYILFRILTQANIRDITMKGQIMAQYNSRDAAVDGPEGGANIDEPNPQERYGDVWEAIRVFLGQHAAVAALHHPPVGRPP